MIGRPGLVWSRRPRTGISRSVGYQTISNRPNGFGSVPGMVTTKMMLGAGVCRRLDTCVTEFGAQGLELDATLLAWGTDLILWGGRWTNEQARGYLKRVKVHDPFQLRVNAYRVLLTRGRDVCVVFVPPIPAMDETFAYLADAGFQPF